MIYSLTRPSVSVMMRSETRYRSRNRRVAGITLPTPLKRKSIPIHMIRRETKSIPTLVIIGVTVTIPRVRPIKRTIKKRIGSGPRRTSTAIVKISRRNLEIGGIKASTTALARTSTERDLSNNLSRITKSTRRSITGIRKSISANAENRGSASGKNKPATTRQQSKHSNALLCHSSGSPWSHFYSSASHLATTSITIPGGAQ